MADLTATQNEPKRDTRQRYMVWRKMKPTYRDREGYSCSEADFLMVSARLQLFLTLDRETAEETHRGCDLHFTIGGDTLEVKTGDYGELLSWVKEQIDKAIEDNRRAILEKTNIRVENT